MLQPSGCFRDASVGHAASKSHATAFSLAQFIDLLAHRPGQLLLEDACSLWCNQLVAPITSVCARRPAPVGSPEGCSGSWQHSVTSLPPDADDLPLLYMTVQGQQDLQSAGTRPNARESSCRPQKNQAESTQGKQPKPSHFQKKIREPTCCRGRNSA
jgi:hypothetical protein